MEDTEGDVGVEDIKLLTQNLHDPEKTQQGSNCISKYILTWRSLLSGSTYNDSKLHGQSCGFSFTKHILHYLFMQEGFSKENSEAGIIILLNSTG